MGQIEQIISRYRKKRYHQIAQTLGVRGNEEKTKKRQSFGEILQKRGKKEAEFLDFPE